MQAVPFQLKMQMGSGGHPCGPDLRSLLPCRHQLPFGHTQLAAMGIKGLDPVPMVQLEVQAVGAGASNQAVKAVAIARGYLAPSGIDLVCVPAFANVLIDSEERTAIKLIVEPR